MGLSWSYRWAQQGIQQTTMHNLLAGWAIKVESRLRGVAAGIEFPARSPFAALRGAARSSKPIGRVAAQGRKMRGGERNWERKPPDNSIQFSGRMSQMPPM